MNMYLQNTNVGSFIHDTSFEWKDTSDRAASMDSSKRNLAGHNPSSENMKMEPEPFPSRSWPSPFSGHQLKQLRAQCLVFLSLRSV